MADIALITGASGGLGRHIVQALAADGYRIALHYFRDEEKARDLCATLPVQSGPHMCFQADLTDEAAIAAMVQGINDSMGAVSRLINNAGIPFSGLSWKQDLSDWQEVFAVNATAPWLLSKYCIPIMRTLGSGRIVHISSIVAHRPLAGTSAYAAAKSALEGLTRAQAVELSRFGITVNCVAPGYFDAGMISSVDETIREDIRAHTPAARLGHAEELAAAISYLCSEKAAFTTGQILHINGGLYI